MNVQLHRALFADAPRDPFADLALSSHAYGRRVRHLTGDLPPCVANMKSRFESVALWTPHVCMANVYAEGSGIGWHLDNDVLRLGIVSLGGDAEFGYAYTDLDAWAIEVSGGAIDPEDRRQLTLRHGDLLLFNDAERVAHTVRNLAPRTSIVFRQYPEGHWNRDSEAIW